MSLEDVGVRTTGENVRMWMAKQAVTGRVVTAAEAVRGLSYVCLDCKEDVILKRGAVKAWHFSHKVVGKCRGESALHQWGKWHWSKDVPVDRTVLVQCQGFDDAGGRVECGRWISQKLFWDVDEAKEEVRVPGGVADVAFYKSGRLVAFVEVYVTSAMRKQRIEESTVPWIEVERGDDGLWNKVRRGLRVDECPWCESRRKELWEARERAEELEEARRRDRAKIESAKRKRRSEERRAAKPYRGSEWSNRNWPDLSDEELARLTAELIQRFYAREYPKPGGSVRDWERLELSEVGG